MSTLPMRPHTANMMKLLAAVLPEDEYRKMQDDIAEQCWTQNPVFTSEQAAAEFLHDNEDFDSNAHLASCAGGDSLSDAGLDSHAVCALNSPDILSFIAHVLGCVRIMRAWNEASLVNAKSVALAPVADAS